MFNKSILMGHLTRDPETRHTNEGLPICRLGLAVNTKRKNDEEVLFIDVTVFGKTAEHCQQYLRKGRPILVEGRIKRDEWEDKQTGAKKHRTGIVADTVRFLGGKADGGQTNTANTGQTYTSPEPMPADDQVPF